MRQSKQKQRAERRREDMKWWERKRREPAAPVVQVVFCPTPGADDAFG